MHLYKQRAHTVLGSKVNNALNTLTWPGREKTHTDCTLDEICEDRLWHVNLILVCLTVVSEVQCTGEHNSRQ